jgi:hypothetical protein
MKCTTCGYETQPSAKFCVQCGTTIVASPAPAGMAPLAAPSVTPRPPAAPPSPPATSSSSTSATAAHPAYTPPPASATAARPAYTPPPASATAARPAYTPPPAPATAPVASATAAPAAPAPSNSSTRLGLIAGVLVLFAVIGIGSFVAYKMLFSAEPKEAVTTVDPNKAADSAPAQPPADATKDGMAPAGSATAGSADNNMSSPQAPPPPPAPDSSATATAPSPDTVKAAPMPKAADAKTKGGPAGKTDTAQSPSNPVAAPSPPRQAAAPVMAPAPQPDRWEQMRQAYELCNKESLFDRLGCNSRVGQQYCKGYWGTVPQCPAGAYGDRGNN